MSELDRLADAYSRGVALWGAMYRTPISGRAAAKVIVQALIDRSKEIAHSYEDDTFRAALSRLLDE